MTKIYPHRFLLLCLLSVLPVSAATDEKGNVAVKNPWYAGIDLAGAAHSEAGLDRSKGEYDVTYTAFGGSLYAQYHLPDYYIHAGAGLMRLMSLTVNKVSIAMEERTQWHVPVFVHAYYRVDPVFALGTGLTHLTETTMYLHGSAVPKSSYHHLFLDIAMQFTPKISDRLKASVTFVFGVNLVPGRQNVYTVTDLLHLRAVLSIGLLYSVF